MLEISECTGQRHNLRLAVVDRFGLFLDLVLPQCCPKTHFGRGIAIGLVRPRPSANAGGFNPNDGGCV